MTTLAEFYEKVRDALSVDGSYLTAFIPDQVALYGRRLLRDYTFPKQAMSTLLIPVAESRTYTLPASLKGILGARFVENDLYSNFLLRSLHPMHLQSDGEPRSYWEVDGDLLTDITAPNPVGDLRLELYYLTNDLATCLPWLVDEYEDVIFSLTMTRAAATLGKAELATTHAALWAEDRQSIAVYLNERQFDKLAIDMRSGDWTEPRRVARYPASSAI